MHPKLLAEQLMFREPSNVSKMMTSREPPLGNKGTQIPMDPWTDFWRKWARLRNKGALMKIKIEEETKVKIKQLEESGLVDDKWILIEWKFAEFRKEDLRGMMESEERALTEIRDLEIERQKFLQQRQVEKVSHERLEEQGRLEEHQHDSRRETQIRNEQASGSSEKSLSKDMPAVEMDDVDGCQMDLLQTRDSGKEAENSSIEDGGIKKGYIHMVGPDHKLNTLNKEVKEEDSRKHDMDVHQSPVGHFGQHFINTRGSQATLYPNQRKDSGPSSDINQNTDIGGHGEFLVLSHKEENTTIFNHHDHSKNQGHTIVVHGLDMKYKDENDEHTWRDTLILEVQQQDNLKDRHQIQGTSCQNRHTKQIQWNELHNIHDVLARDNRKQNHFPHRMPSSKNRFLHQSSITEPEELIQKSLESPLEPPCKETHTLVKCQPDHRNSIHVCATGLAGNIDERDSAENGRCKVESPSPCSIRSYIISEENQEGKHDDGRQRKSGLSDDIDDIMKSGGQTVSVQMNSGSWLVNTSGQLWTLDKLDPSSSQLWTMDRQDISFLHKDRGRFVPVDIFQNAPQLCWPLGDYRDVSLSNHLRYEGYSERPYDLGQFQSAKDHMYFEMVPMSCTHSSIYLQWDEFYVSGINSPSQTPVQEDNSGSREVLLCLENCNGVFGSVQDNVHKDNLDSREILLGLEDYNGGVCGSVSDNLQDNLSSREVLLRLEGCTDGRCGSVPEVTPRSRGVLLCWEDDGCQVSGYMQNILGHGQHRALNLLLSVKFSGLKAYSVANFNSLVTVGSPGLEERLSASCVYGMSGLTRMQTTHRSGQPEQFMIPGMAVENIDPGGTTATLLCYGMVHSTHMATDLSNSSKTRIHVHLFYKDIPGQVSEAMILFTVSVCSNPSNSGAMGDDASDQLSIISGTSWDKVQNSPQQIEQMDIHAGQRVEMSATESNISSLMLSIKDSLIFSGLQVSTCSGDGVRRSKTSAAEDHQDGNISMDKDRKSNSPHDHHLLNTSLLEEMFIGVGLERAYPKTFFCGHPVVGTPVMSEKSNSTRQVECVRHITSQDKYCGNNALETQVGTLTGWSRLSHVIQCNLKSTSEWFFSGLEQTMGGVDSTAHQLVQKRTPVNQLQARGTYMYLNQATLDYQDPTERVNDSYISAGLQATVSKDMHSNGKKNVPCRKLYVHEVICLNVLKTYLFPISVAEIHRLAKAGLKQNDQTNGYVYSLPGISTSRTSQELLMYGCRKAKEDESLQPSESLEQSEHEQLQYPVETEVTQDESLQPCETIEQSDGILSLAVEHPTESDINEQSEDEQSKPSFTLVCPSSDDELLQLPPVAVETPAEGESLQASEANDHSKDTPPYSPVIDECSKDSPLQGSSAMNEPSDINPLQMSSEVSEFVEPVVEGLPHEPHEFGEPVEPLPDTSINTQSLEEDVSHQSEVPAELLLPMAVDGECDTGSVNEEVQGAVSETSSPGSDSTSNNPSVSPCLKYFLRCLYMGSNIYVCEYCPYKTMTMPQVVSHLHSHNMAETTWECCSCKYFSEWPRKVMTHVEQQHPEDELQMWKRVPCGDYCCGESGGHLVMFYCRYCQFSDKSRTAVIKHINDKHRNCPSIIICRFFRFVQKLSPSYHRNEKINSHKDLESLLVEYSGLYKWNPDFLKCQLDPELHGLVHLSQLLESDSVLASKEKETELLENEDNDGDCGIASKLGTQLHFSSTTVKNSWFNMGQLSIKHGILCHHWEGRSQLKLSMTQTSLKSLLKGCICRYLGKQKEVYLMNIHVLMISSLGTCKYIDIVQHKPESGQQTGEWHLDCILKFRFQLFHLLFQFPGSGTGASDQEGEEEEQEEEPSQGTRNELLVLPTLDSYQYRTKFKLWDSDGRLNKQCLQESFLACNAIGLPQVGPVDKTHLAQLPEQMMEAMITRDTYPLYIDNGLVGGDTQFNDDDNTQVEFIEMLNWADVGIASECAMLDSIGIFVWTSAFGYGVCRIKGSCWTHETMQEKRTGKPVF